MVFQTEKDFTEQELIESLLVLFKGKEAIVEIAVLAGVNPDKLSSTLVLKHGVNHHLLALLGQLQERVEILLLDPVEIIQLLYLRVQGFYYMLRQTLILIPTLFESRLVVFEKSVVLRLDYSNKIECVFD